MKTGSIFREASARRIWGATMPHFMLHTALATGAALALAAAPASAQLVRASDPQAIKAIVESHGWPATLVQKDGEDPYIESNRNGLQFLVLFMNCTEGKNCRTLKYYMGFSDAKEKTPEKPKKRKRH